MYTAKNTKLGNDSCQMESKHNKRKFLNGKELPTSAEEKTVENSNSARNWETIGKERPNKRTLPNANWIICQTQWNWKFSPFCLKWQKVCRVKMVQFNYWAFPEKMSERKWLVRMVKKRKKGNSENTITATINSITNSQKLCAYCNTLLLHPKFFE